MNKPLLAAVSALAVVGLVAPAAPAAALDTVDTSKLRAAVTVAAILRHERDLQHIAAANGNTRESGTPAYDAAATYVKKDLKDAGYTVHTQKFTYPQFVERTPSTLAQVTPSAESFTVSTFTYSGSAAVTGPMVLAHHIGVRPPVGTSGQSGCTAGDFDAPPSASAVVLVQRGTCSYQTKADLAAAAGYAAVVVFDDLDSGTSPLIGALDHPTRIPVLSVGYASGDELVARIRNHTAVTVRLTASTAVEQRTTTNLWAATGTGKTGRSVVVGAHLDTLPPQPPLNRSPEGAPGIDDNGSGVSTVLEIARQMHELGYTKKHHLQRQVRFVFFGAEEAGRFGSAHYVDSLSPSALAKLDAYVDVDTIGSPDYGRFVDDGDGSSVGTGGPAGSGAIEKVFTDYFRAQKLSTQPAPLDGTSDYAAFAAAGVPVGGVTSETRATRGDCYHQSCDDLRNLDPQALYELGDAVADATLVLAQSASTLLPNAAPRTRHAVASTTGGSLPRV